MDIHVSAVPPFQKNGFIVSCERTRRGVLIDPGDEVPELLEFVRSSQIGIDHILLTHAHLDHVTGVGEAKEALAAPVHLHRDDLPLYEQVEQQGAMFGIRVRRQPDVDRFYDGSPIIFGDYEVRVHHTPGHCPGGVCLQIEDESTGSMHLFVGDTLFASSIGRTDLPGGDYDTLMQSITRVLFPLGDEAIVHPGHGPDTTIRRERTMNPFVLEYLADRR
jgi:glyoxylase-like metal-dependent hydrolase (beta-lactamase superfamily II)